VSHIGELAVGEQCVQLTRTGALQFNGENLLDERYYVLDNYDDTYFGSP
jgi:outer membrane receptor for ferric coprogen and ferric-rhodotorulic acid